ncbi:MAG: DUF3343 domain-containing protein [Firmicutes bacterium]|nr:DUF3343 domain-containing protein [Bacillota bacterium]
MSDKKEINYYVLFKTYTQGMALHELLRGNGIRSRISPAPRSIQGELGCGMSLLILEEDIDAVRRCIAEHNAEYHDIVPLENQINPNRHRFC